MTVPAPDDLEPGPPGGRGPLAGDEGPQTAPGGLPSDPATAPPGPRVPEWACEICGPTEDGEGWRFIAKSARGLRTHRSLTHGSRPAEGGEPHDRPAGSGDGPSAGRESMPGIPDRKRRTLRDILGRRVDAERANEPKTKRRLWTGKREPLEDGFTWAYGGIGTMIVRSGTDMTPVGRVMEMQAPLVGVKADAAIAGTLADRVLQPFVATGKQWREVGEMVGLPIMTAMIVRRPELLGLKRRVVDGVEMIVAEGPLFQPYYSLWQANAVALAHGYERTELKRQAIVEDLKKVPFLRPAIERGEDPIFSMMLEVLGLEVPPAEPAAPPAGPVVARPGVAEPGAA